VGALGPTTGESGAASDRRRIYCASIQSGRLWQGEILSPLPQSKLALTSLPQTNVSSEAGNAPTVTVEFDEHPLVIVLSQDCDLEQDFKARTSDNRVVLFNVLLCDVHQSEELHGKLKAEENKNSNEWRKIRENLDQRFHFLRGIAIDEDAEGIGFQNLAIDFRRYFSIPTDELYERLKLKMTLKRCRLQTPYAEHLANRFHSFQMRVPLSKEHHADS